MLQVDDSEMQNNRHGDVEFFLCSSISAESRFQFSVLVSLVTHLTDEDTSSHSDIPDTLSTLSDGDNNAP